MTAQRRDCGNNPALHFLWHLSPAPTYKNNKSRRTSTANAIFFDFSWRGRSAHPVSVGGLISAMVSAVTHTRRRQNSGDRSQEKSKKRAALLVCQRCRFMCFRTLLSPDSFWLSVRKHRRRLVIVFHQRGSPTRTYGSQDAGFTRPTARAEPRRANCAR